jgi:hypothetical protein
VTAGRGGAPLRRCGVAKRINSKEHPVSGPADPTGRPTDPAPVAATSGVLFALIGMLIVLAWLIGCLVLRMIF